RWKVDFENTRLTSTWRRGTIRWMPKFLGACRPGFHPLLVSTIVFMSSISVTGCSQWRPAVPSQGPLAIRSLRHDRYHVGETDDPRLQAFEFQVYLSSGQCKHITVARKNGWGGADSNCSNWRLVISGPMSCGG